MPDLYASPDLMTQAALGLSTLSFTLALMRVVLRVLGGRGKPRA